MNVRGTLSSALARAACAAALLFSTASLWAGPLTYEYRGVVDICPFGAPNGPCGTPATPGPIVVGSIIDGYVTFSDSAAASGSATAVDVIDFFFDVAGIFALSPANGQSIGAATALNLQADGVTGLFELVLPNLAGPGITGLLHDDGQSWDITIPQFGNALVNGGSSTWTVPEPSSLGLLLLGLVLFWHRRGHSRRSWLPHRRRIRIAA